MKFSKSLNIDNLSLITLILLLSLQLFTVCNLVIFFCCICLSIVSKRNRTVKGILIIIVYGIKTIEILKMKGGREREEGEMEGSNVEDINVEEGEDIREGSIKLKDLKEEDKEVGTEEGNMEVGIEEVVYEEDNMEKEHTLSLNQDHNPLSLEDSLLKDHNPLEDHPLEDYPLTDHPFEDHNPLLHKPLTLEDTHQNPLPSNQPLLLQNDFIKESKPLNVNSIPLFTEIKIKIKSKDLSEGKILMNGMEIGNIETERVQLVS